MKAGLACPYSWDTPGIVRAVQPVPAGLGARTSWVIRRTTSGARSSRGKLWFAAGLAVGLVLRRAWAEAGCCQRPADRADRLRHAAGKETHVGIRIVGYAV